MELVVFILLVKVDTASLVVPLQVLLDITQKVVTTVYLFAHLTQPLKNILFLNISTMVVVKQAVL